MLTTYKTSAIIPPGASSYQIVNITLGAGPDNNKFFALGWCATARTNETAFGAVGNKYDSATRTSTSCFMRGLKEAIRFDSNRSVPITWRRIVVSWSGVEYAVNPTGTPGIDQQAFLFNLGNLLGWSRSATLLAGDDVPLDAEWVWINIANKIFKGEAFVDWAQFINAPVDVSRVRLLYDKTTVLRSGNDENTPMTKQVKRWHPINKTIIYNDDERGGGKFSSAFSSESKKSFGDVYVFDLFNFSPYADEGDTLTIDFQASLYWHER